MSISAELYMMAVNEKLSLDCRYAAARQLQTSRKTLVRDEYIPSKRAVTKGQYLNLCELLGDKPQSKWKSHFKIKQQ